METIPAAAAQSSPAADPQPIDEAQLTLAMKRLKLLYIKARLLRETIPKMIEPLVQKQPSPDVMFNAFIKAVNDAQTDVKEFTDLMRDEESKRVFALAKRSREENPFGIRPWMHKDHPNWFKLDKD